MQLVTDKEGSAEGYEKQRKILLCKGPFVSTRLAQRNFSGNSRASAAALNAIMENLATDGLGTIQMIDRSTVFFKKLPADVDQDDLKKYEVARENYLHVFSERADKAIISKELFNKFLNNSPHKDRLRQEHNIVQEDDDDVNAV